MPELPRDLTIQETALQEYSPAEIVLVDGHHQVTDDAWKVFRPEEKLAKVVTTRRFRVETAPHSRIVTLQQGIRVWVFYHIKGKDPQSEYEHRHYMDHIHHIAFQVAILLGAQASQLKLVHNNIKKQQSNQRMREDNRLFIDQVRRVLRKVLIAGTTNLAVLRHSDADPISFQLHQQGDLFDQDMPEEFRADFMAEMEEDDMPLFSWDVRTLSWGRGSVSDYLPDPIPQVAVIRDQVDRALDTYFQEHLLPKFS